MAAKQRVVGRLCFFNVVPTRLERAPQEKALHFIIIDDQNEFRA